ncbi:MAG: prolipoprotein diacylglyceryl transferase [Victivallales bacterium]|jgi:phosphatidylglycerol:prolipoprotein diacylglycerol transferase|nr:prolipoprotein diacylglyceryl transferase [Victivallales bacterium]
MYPVLFSIGNFSIRSYGAMAAAGFLLGYYLVNVNRKYAKMSSDQASTSLFVALIAGIVGARLFYVIQFFDQYRHDLWEIFRIDHGGLVFYGGFILTIAALWVYTRKSKLDIIRVFDVYAPALAIAHACGRIGCFLNGCCWGRPTTLFFGVTYPQKSSPAQCYPGEALYPVQLFEAGEQIALFFLYFYLVRHARRGVAMSSYIILYGVLRFLNEFMRGDNDKILELFTVSQLIGIVIVPIGAALLIYFLRYAPKENEPKNTKLSD